MTRIDWPDLYLPPINLLNVPRQPFLEDYMKTRIPVESLQLSANTRDDADRVSVKLTPDQAAAVLEALDERGAFAPVYAPCPFCAAAVDINCCEFDEAQGRKWGAVVCQHCAARGPEVRTGNFGPVHWAPEALAVWDQRAREVDDD